MWGFGLRLQVQHGHLCAEWGIGRDRHKLRLSRVNRNLKRVIIVGSGGYASFDAINWIADIRASLIFLDRRGKLLFASTPTAPSDVRLRRAQSLALGNGTALKISRELISQKLDGQSAIVRDMLGNSVAAEAILRFRAELAETNNIDAVRLVEAQAAKIYWSQWTDVPIRWPHKDESRVPAHWKRFVSRISPITHSPRLATNPANACMNLIHTLCEAECRIALIATGLDPDIGLLHYDAPNRSSLANDLQEILRPTVDSFVLNWIQTEPFRKADFWEDKNGNCRLMSHLCAKLSETAPMWGRLVAPWAEYVARTLWASSARSESARSRMPATRLTQQNRREAKGRLHFPPLALPKPDAVCLSCGRQVQKRGARVCSKCALTATRKTFDIGRRNAQQPESLAKRSATQRQHKLAIQHWQSSDLPGWLTRDVYVKRIVPALMGIPKFRIRSTLGVSEPYSSDIRAGKRIPHPRHWQALAELAGVSNPL
jgi:CRISPR-associated protein Cas1